jgi:hypothetical protein
MHVIEFLWTQDNRSRGTFNDNKVDLYASKLINKNDKIKIEEFDKTSWVVTVNFRVYFCLV